MDKGKVIIISAPSGSGKTTIIGHLLKQGFKLSFSVSATSRAKREKEKNGVDYYFFNSEEFKNKIDKSEFLEWEEVYESTFYGTLKNEVEKNLNVGKNVIFDVDVVGAVSIKKYFTSKALSIFIKPPSIEVLKDRLYSRSSDSKEAIEMRIEKSEKEIEFWKQNIEEFDITIVNDKLETALQEAINVVGNFLKY